MKRLTLHGAAPYSLLGELEEISKLGRPPIENWDPPLSGDIDITITRDGNWYHEGHPMTRPRLVRLFSTILRREASGDYVLVTPVEKWRIQVEDVPFQAVLLGSDGEGEAQRLTFTTNVHDLVTVDREHPLRVETEAALQQPAPCVLVRDHLEARLARSAWYQLMELAIQREYRGENWVGVWSSGEFFPLMAYREEV